MDGMMDLPALGKQRTRFLLAALLPTLATALAWTPHVFSNPDDVSPVLLVLLVVSAPAVALVVNWRWPAATNRDRATWAALPQVVVVPLMARLDTWMEVQRGYLLRGSGEEAMSYGLGLFLGLIVGIILLVLVGFTGRLGAWLGRRERPVLDSTRA